VSCFYDYHGKTYGAVSLGHIRSHVYGAVRGPGAHMVPRPDTYRPLWTKADGTIDTLAGASSDPACIHGGYRLANRDRRLERARKNVDRRTRRWQICNASME
jgi:hypothetical protein